VGPGLARGERADPEGRADAPAISLALQRAGEVDGAADRRAAVDDRDQAAVDLDAAERVEREVGEVDDPAAAAERDAVEEHADLLRRRAAQRQRRELPQAPERPHGHAGAAGQDLRQPVRRPGPALVGQLDRGREPGAARVEPALRVEPVALARAHDRAVRAGLRDRSGRAGLRDR